MQFGPDALEFAQQELRSAADEFDGPLAARLVALELGLPFGFLAPDTDSSERDWRSGGTDDGMSDRCLAVAVSKWLRAPDLGHRRLVALEDPLARYADPGIDPRVMHFNDRIYHSAHHEAGSEDVFGAFGRLAGYPGVGVIARPQADPLEARGLTNGELDALAAATVAVLVRARDDEAFLVVPVVGGLTPSDLQC